MELSEATPGEAGIDRGEGVEGASSSPSAQEERPRAEDLARDLALVRSAQRGDPSSLERLAQRLSCVPRLLARLNARRGSRLSAQDVEDLSQDALLGIWRKLGSYHGQATFEGWLYRFCFLEFMNRVRLESRRPEAPAGHPTGVADPSGDALDLEREELEHALAVLEPSDAEVVRLKHFDQLTFDDIARALGMTPKMAKTRYYRGLASLQRELGARRRQELR